MTAHDYLKQLSRLKWEISSCTKAIETLEEEVEYDYQMSGIDYSRDKVMTSPSSNQYKQSERRVDMRVELIRKRNRLRDDLTQKRECIISQIHGIEKQPHVEVLERYYVYCESLLSIAMETHRSYDRTRHIHSEALGIFTEKYADVISQHTLAQTDEESCDNV